MTIAIIGSGIAGLAAAHALAPHHEVTLFEREPRAGGHAHTVDIDYDGVPIAVDTGFIVYNSLNYPLLSALFAHLGIATEESDMSFSLSIGGGTFEWAGADDLTQLFAQRRNLFRPAFLAMLWDILRFNRVARRDLRRGALADLSLGDYLRQRGFGSTFAQRYLLPMGAAIWSMPLQSMLDFPAQSLVAFFDNHRLLDFKRPRWRTVTGGSRVYVEALVRTLRGDVRLATPVAGLRRLGNGVEVRLASGELHSADHAVLACHSDEALRLLTDASADERAILGALRYAPNRAYLHRDARLMPRRRRAWASWNVVGTDNPAGPVAVTYWMNRLQNIDVRRPLFVTLNPPVLPREDLTFADFAYDHPQFDRPALAAQAQLDRIQGRRNTWFAGAYWSHGFHEDGIRSGLAVARALGAAAPWSASLAPPPRVAA